MEERIAALEQRLSQAEAQFAAASCRKQRVTLLSAGLMVGLSLVFLAITAHCSSTLDALAGFARPGLAAAVH